MSFLQKHQIEQPYANAIDYDPNNDLILSQSETDVKSFSNDGKLLKQTQIRPVLIASNKVMFRFCPNSDLKKICVQSQQNVLEVFDEQSKKLFIKFGSMFKKETIVGFEWVTGQILIVVLKKSVSIVKVLWAKGEQAPIIDQKQDIEIQTTVKTHQFIDNKYLLLSCNEENVDQFFIVKFTEKPQLKLSLSNLNYTDTRQIFGFVLRQQFNKLYDQEAEEHLLSQESLCQQTENDLGLIKQHLAVKQEFCFSPQMKTQKLSPSSTLLILKLLYTSVQIMNETQLLTEAKIPSPAYSQVFVCENLLYVVNPNTLEYICYDVIGRAGQVNQNADNAVVTDNLAIGRLSIVYLQKLSANESTNVSVEQSEPVESKPANQGERLKIRYPLILKQCLRSSMNRISLARIDAKGFVQSLGTINTLADLILLFYVCIYRSDAFIEPFVEALQRFLASHYENLTTFFELILNYCLEVRICKQIQQDVLPTLKLNLSDSFVESSNLSISNIQNSGIHIKMLSNAIQVKVRGKCLVYPRVFLLQVQSIIQYINLLDPDKKKFYAVQLLTALQKYELSLNSEQLVMLLSPFDNYEIQNLIDLRLLQKHQQTASALVNLAERGSDPRIAIRIYKECGMGQVVDELRQEFGL
ncbi:Conserved_hypothetical protein [Hexamita inflata]|uniref:Mic1 domain-containing protein n=2 Tax=Hexamita inflata TaxID=28002 RepID=A0AA86PP52_9EUKA|nr:Conserved hypothetical protein [Hexamita inflata]